MSNYGPSGAIRTPGPVNPNHVRYQLRYTRIFSFCYYTTPQAKIKDFPVCGQLCGQSRFSARLGGLAKSRKCPCRKDFRASAIAIVDGAANAPKAGALPTALHPVIELFYPAGRILPNVARYQLRYTRMFDCDDYSTKNVRLKGFPG